MATGFKEVEVKENPLPTPRSKPWGMFLNRDGKTCHILVVGYGGGKKAGFKVQFADLANAVRELEAA
jgi:hypothetical protein